MGFAAAGRGVAGSPICDGAGDAGFVVGALTEKEIVTGRGAP